MKRFNIALLLSILCLSTYAQDLVGTWSGLLNVGAAKLTLVLNITKGEDGKLACTLDSPDQGAKGIPGKIEQGKDGKITVSVPSISAAYEFTLSGDKLSGTFTQGFSSLPLEMKRGGVERDRPQTPKRPYPYATEEVTFNSADGKATLSGTLTLPVGFDNKAKGSVPVVVMVSGSGLQDRDETLFGHKPFLVLADYLARNGIASLRYDDRGFGKSKGEAASATTHDFMEDAEGGVTFLRKGARFGKVGVLGHSEGGLIAFMLAAQGKADFVVCLAGPGVRGDSVIIDQNRTLVGSMGLPRAYVENLCSAVREATAYVVSGGKANEAGQAVKKILAKYPSLPAEQTEKQLGALMSNPWMGFFLKYDPTSDISNTKCPVMALNGSKDMQVGASVNLGAIRRLLPKNKSNVVKEYTGLNHLFQHCTMGFVTEYGQIAETMSPEVLKDVAEWINTLK